LVSKSAVGIIYESNSTSRKSEYSYLQYHWCPIVLSVTLGLFTSSSIYKSRKDGKAIKIKIIAGTTVQIISIVCPSSKNRLVIELKNNVAIIYPTKVVIKISTIIAWSWKKISCSIRGEALSWKPKKPHVAIFYGNINFVIGS